MLNVVALMGRLVADPELRHTPQGVSVTTFTIAVDRSFVRQGEQRQADFIDIVCWRSSAEFVCKYFQKGSLIAVNGSIQTRTYQDKNGTNRTDMEVVVEKVHFVGAKSASNTDSNAQPAARQQPTAQPQTAPQFEDVSDDPDLPF